MGTVTITFPSILPSLATLGAFFRIGFFVLIFALGVGVTVWMYLRLNQNLKNGSKPTSRFSAYYSAVSLIGILYFAIVMVQ